jgi:hypothetical protein
MSEHLRSFRTNIWIDVIERGRAIVYSKFQDKDIDDVWHIKDNLKQKAKIFGYRKITEIDIGDRLDAERRLPNFVMDFTFPDLDPETKAEYIRLKELSRETEDESEDKRTLAYTLGEYLDKAIYGHMEGKMPKTIKGMAEYIGMQRTQLNKRINNYKDKNNLNQDDKDEEVEEPKQDDTYKL